MPDTYTLGACSRPKIAIDATPARIADGVADDRVARRAAPRPSASRRSGNAVAPRLGNTSGCLTMYAHVPLNPIATSDPTNV